MIALENVEEFQDWGPLIKDGPNAGKANPDKKGQTFRAFVRKLERLGYVVEWKLLRACDYGAPTTRRRLFLVARCDGKAIRWPEPTHGPGRELPHQPAAKIMDWDIECPSIFERTRPLADKTMARIARGIRKYVLENPRPFIISTAHGGKGRNDLRVADSAEPLRTVTGSRRGDHAIVVPYLVHRSNGERKGQEPRTYPITKPHPVVVAQGLKTSLCVALLVKHYGARNPNEVQATPLDRSIDTVTAQDHHSLVAVHLTKMYGTSTGSDVRDAVPTVTANNKGGGHLGVVAAFLARHDASAPKTEAVTVKIDGETYVLADIGMRMLTPRELYRAQGFPESYKIDPIIEKKGKRAPLTKTAQIRMCGNSVCPPLASVIARAQFTEAS